MKVKDLMQLLSEKNPELIVVVDGYECGFDEVDKIKDVLIIPNSESKKKTWEGEYHEDYLKLKGKPALLLPRKS